MPNKNSESIATRGSVAFFLTGCRSPPALKIAKKCPTTNTPTKTAQNEISSRREGNSADKDGSGYFASTYFAKKSRHLLAKRHLRRPEVSKHTSRTPSQL